MAPFGDTSIPLGKVLTSRHKLRKADSHTSASSSQGQNTFDLYAPLAEKSSEKPGNAAGLKAIFMSPICILLVAFPVGVIGKEYCGLEDSYVFWLMFASMIPLAKILGDATEELAANLKNDMISGLLNATFGNAVEMIMTIAFLQTHEYLVVKTTLIGSILSNMLLVLGMSFFAGGCVKKQVGTASEEVKNAGKGKEQKYNTLGALMNTSMLLLACFAFLLCTVFNYVDNTAEGAEEAREYMLPISRGVSFLVIGSYVAFIIFQLFTHNESIKDDEEEGEEEEEEANLSLPASLVLLLCATVVVAVASEYLTGSLETALESSGMGKAFVGIILLPIVGNACEHAAAIRFAMQDKAGLSVGIAVGSSVQIALFVAPWSVLAGWALGDSPEGLNMDLDFGVLDVTVLTLSVIIIFAIVVDGKSNWLEGYMLMTAYAIVGILYWKMPEEATPK